MLGENKFHDSKEKKVKEEAPGKLKRLVRAEQMSEKKENGRRDGRENKK